MSLFPTAPKPNVPLLQQPSSQPQPQLKRKAEGAAGSGSKRAGVAEDGWAAAAAARDAAAASSTAVKGPRRRTAAGHWVES